MKRKFPNGVSSQMVTMATCMGACLPFATEISSNEAIKVHHTQKICQIYQTNWERGRAGGF